MRAAVPLQTNSSTNSAQPMASKTRCLLVCPPGSGAVLGAALDGLRNQDRLSASLRMATPLALPLGAARRSVATGSHQVVGALAKVALPHVALRTHVQLLLHCCCSLVGPRLSIS